MNILCLSLDIVLLHVLTELQMALMLSPEIACHQLRPSLNTYEHSLSAQKTSSCHTKTQTGDELAVQWHGDQHPCSSAAQLSFVSTSDCKFPSKELNQVQGDHHNDSNVKEHTHLEDTHRLSFTFSSTLKGEARPLLHTLEILTPCSDWIAARSELVPWQQGEWFTLQWVARHLHLHRW